jgi:hypothetical protein
LIEVLKLNHGGIEGKRPYRIRTGTCLGIPFISILNRIEQQVVDLRQMLEAEVPASIHGVARRIANQFLS